MNNNSQSRIKMISEEELEKKFKDDLEKATALSLETLALEEFNKKRRGHNSFSSYESTSFRNNNGQYWKLSFPI